MTDILVDSTTWLFVAVTLFVVVVIGRMRHESWLSIAMAGVGVNAFLIGVRWAGSIGGEAAAAVWVATGGMALWGEAVRIGGRRSTTARS